MSFLYPFFITFFIVFLAELGDKTQLLVLSFSSKDKASNILLGVAIGTFLSHGIAILFGSQLGSLENSSLNFYLKIFTYISFLLFGILGFIPKKNLDKCTNNSKVSFLQKLSCIKLNPMLIIAISIFIGEIGDKTFLSSLGLGLQYPYYKLSLIAGSVAGMVASNSIAIFFGKLLGSKLNSDFIQVLSNILFIVFGLIGLISYFFEALANTVFNL